MTRYKLNLPMLLACIVILLNANACSRKKIGLIYFYHRTTSSPESRARLAIVPQEVAINDYKREAAETINLPFATFQLPKVEDAKVSTTKEGVVIIRNQRFYITMLPPFHVPQALDELVEKKEKQNEEMISMISAFNKTKVKLANPLPPKIDSTALEKDMALFGMPGSYEREMLTQMTLPKPLYKLAVMPLPDLERYVMPAFNKAISMKKDLGYFHAPHVKGVITFGFGNQGHNQVSVWSLEQPVSQGFYYDPKDMMDLEPLKMMLDTLVYLPEKTNGN